MKFSHSLHIVPPTKAELADRIRLLFASNPFSAPLGIELLECDEGHASLRMPVTEACLNAHGSGHGGAIWTLADMAFGAAGYYDGQILTTASTLNFVRPAPPGVPLLARGRQLTRTRRAGHFDITIHAGESSDTTLIAFGQFSGQWLRHIVKNTPHVPEAHS